MKCLRPVVGGGGGQRTAVRRKHVRRKPLLDQIRVGIGRETPEAHGLVLAAGGQRGAVGRERHGEDFGGMTKETPFQLTGN